MRVSRNISTPTERQVSPSDFCSQHFQVHKPLTVDVYYTLPGGFGCSAFTFPPPSSFIWPLLLFKQSFHTWPWLASIILTFRVRHRTPQKGNAFWLLPGCESPVSVFNYLKLIYTHKHYKKKRYGGSKCMQAVIIYKSFSRLIGAFFPALYSLVRSLWVDCSYTMTFCGRKKRKKDGLDLCQTHRIKRWFNDNLLHKWGRNVASGG